MDSRIRFQTYGDEKHLYNSGWQGNRYHYGDVLCTQRMYRLGGKYWDQFLPALVIALLKSQKKDGA